jgi:anthranilate/para-aminobenzoate synthase component I
MIVDLERNDLGRVSRAGTVRVEEPRRIESYATVHHAVSRIAGQLRPGLGWAAILRAMFPGGSITGCPKIRAMEILSELEPEARGIYTGSIGWICGDEGALNIAIRTPVVESGKAWVQVGGGIVADSDPQAEYEETLHKGRAFLAPSRQGGL